VDSVYFESSVLLAILSGEDSAKKIRSLARELKKNKVRIYTSMITVQEISVLSFRRGTVVDDPLSKLHKMVRFASPTKEICLTAAKLEAQIKDNAKLPKDEQINENRRRKWDCFHIATAMCLGCKTIYTEDEKFLKRKKQLGIDSLEFSPPIPKEPLLDLEARESPEEKPTPTGAAPSFPAAPEAQAVKSAATAEVEGTKHVENTRTEQQDPDLVPASTTTEEGKEGPKE
jgi:predicted nucleic acid-binding protein